MNEKKTQYGGTIRFQELMKELDERLGRLSFLVIDMIKTGKTALLTDDTALYDELAEELKQVHVISDEVESSVHSSLALHQPFAKDLRYILSSLKITNEIHRSAHDAVHIAHSSIFVNLKDHSKLIKRVGKLADKSLDMFQKSIDAYLHKKELDVDKWKNLDDAIDEYHAKLINDITEAIEKNPSWSRAGISLILTTRYIERIADHACNIVEESNFVVTGNKGKIE